MNCGLTPRQRDLFTFIKAYQALHEFSPSFDEMRTGVGLKSRSGVHRLLTGLERRGFIHRIRDHARAIEIVSKPHFKPDLTKVPLPELYAELRRREAV